MKKRTAIIFVFIAIVVILTAAFTAYYTLPSNSSPNEVGFLPAGEPPHWQVKVTGDFAQEKTWSVKELSQMPLTNVTILGESDNYTGVTLIEFCQPNQPKLGRRSPKHNRSQRKQRYAKRLPSMEQHVLPILL
jgi:hypothetical protein